jgi:hypothetical protein
MYKIYVYTPDHKILQRYKLVSKSIASALYHVGEVVRACYPFEYQNLIIEHIK